MDNLILFVNLFVLELAAGLGQIYQVDLFIDSDLHLVPIRFGAEQVKLRKVLIQIRFFLLNFLVNFLLISLLFNFLVNIFLIGFLFDNKFLLFLLEIMILFL
jgi:hypothetical protein